MKIHKENVKRYFKDKHTITALVLLFCFLCVFFVSLTNFATSIKGIVELFSNHKIADVYTNNYSVVYAVDEDNTLYYSYNKLNKGHLNSYEGIEPLDNEYGSATTHYYNFISISYKFNSKIVKVDGFRDSMLATDGYTLVLTKNKELYVLYESIQQGAPWLKIADNIIDFDVGYQNFTTLNSNHQVVEYFHKDAYFYMLETQTNNINKIASQGHKKNTENQNVYISYYVTDSNQIIQNKITIDYDKLVPVNCETTEIPAVKKLDRNEINIESKTLNIVTDVKQILAIENATIILNNNNEIYAIGDNYIGDTYVEEDSGIFGNDVRSYDEFTLIASNIKNVKSISTGGPFCLLIYTKNGIYYSGNVGYETSNEFKKINKYGKIDEIYPSYYSTIVLKKGIVYYINYDEGNSFTRMYENYIMKYIVRYVSLFLSVMTLFYLVVYFCEENSRYNRYFKRRYEENETKQDN